MTNSSSSSSSNLNLNLKVLFLTLILANITPSEACVNEYNTLLSGDIIFTDPADGGYWKREIDTIKLLDKADWLLKSYIASNDIKAYSDYGAALIYLGKYYEAKKIYEEIEAIKPNLYTTASNLGTVYELIGKPDSALIWIKKSIDKNPKSHNGSEWIHIKILEYQISGSKDDGCSILGLDFGTEGTPTNPKGYNLKELEQHIRHQLYERTNFVKTKNYTVGNIYFDLGNVIAQTRDVESALKSYDAALMYGYKSDLLLERIAKLETIGKYKEIKKAINQPKDFLRDHFFVLFYTGLLLVFLGSILAYKLFKKFRNKSSQ